MGCYRRKMPVNSRSQYTNLNKLHNNGTPSLIIPLIILVFKKISLIDVYIKRLVGASLFS